MTGDALGRNADGCAKVGAAKGDSPSQAARQSRHRISAQPAGKANGGRIAALPLRLLAGSQRRSRRLALHPAIRFRTPVISVNRPYVPSQTSYISIAAADLHLIASITHVGKAGPYHAGVDARPHRNA
jgi:hypothetical protein